MHIPQHVNNKTGVSLRPCTPSHTTLQLPDLVKLSAPQSNYGCWTKSLQYPFHKGVKLTFTVYPNLYLKNGNAFIRWTHHNILSTSKPFNLVSSTYSKKWILSPSSIIFQMFPKPPWSKYPLMRMAKRPTNMMPIWKTSVHITAFMPPCQHIDDVGQ